MQYYRVHDFSSDAATPIVFRPQVPSVPALKNDFLIASLESVITPRAPVFHHVLSNRSSFSSHYMDELTERVKQKLFIKGPQTDVVIPKRLGAAMPFVRSVFDLQRREGRDVSNLWAQLHIHQAYLRCGECIVTDTPHIDTDITAIMRKKFLNVQQYAATNISPTAIFAEEVRGLSPDLQFCSDEEALEKFNLALAKHCTTTSATFAAPYQVYQFESTVPHREVPVTQDGLRTFLMVRMHAGDCLPSDAIDRNGEINNKHLLSALRL